VPTSRPSRVVAVVGTGTEVGKTAIAAGLVSAWRSHGRSVAVRKPAQSFDPDSQDRTDAQILSQASGEHPDQVTSPTLSYGVALAPPMAAAALGVTPPHLIDLVAACQWPTPRVDLGVVELVGGVCSPHAQDADGLDLLRALSPDALVVVADAGLGTINAVRLTMAALRRTLGGIQSVVVLNRFDPHVATHVANRTWLAGKDELEVVTVKKSEINEATHHLSVAEDVWEWAQRLG